MNDANIKWKSFYKMGGVSSWLLTAYSLVTLVIVFMLGEMPATAQEGFDMLAENRLAGMLRMDLLTILFMPFYYLVLLGLHGKLRERDGAMSLLALLLGLIGVSMVEATPSVFSFVTLSDKFAAATDAAQQTLLLAAGEAILASDLWHASGALVGGILMQIAMVIYSVMMVRSDGFSKATAWIGVFMHGMDLLHIVVGLFAPAAGTVLLLIAGPFYLIWYPLLARDLFKMAR